MDDAIDNSIDDLINNTQRFQGKVDLSTYSIRKRPLEMKETPEVGPASKASSKRYRSDFHLFPIDKLAGANTARHGKFDRKNFYYIAKHHANMTSDPEFDCDHPRLIATLSRYYIPQPGALSFKGSFYLWGGRSLRIWRECRRSAGVPKHGGERYISVNRSPPPSGHSIAFLRSAGHVFRMHVDSSSSCRSNGTDDG